MPQTTSPVEGKAMTHSLLKSIASPQDVRHLTRPQLKTLAAELRYFLLHSLSSTRGHFVSFLCRVELLVALQFLG